MREQGMNGMRVQATPVLDELATDEGAVVLVRTSSSHYVVRLSLLGRLIREIAADGVTCAHLVEELQKQLGPPPDGGDVAELVAAALEELEHDGLVTLQSPPAPEPS